MVARWRCAGRRGYGAALGSHAPPRPVPCRGDPLLKPVSDPRHPTQNVMCRACRSEESKASYGDPRDPQPRRKCSIYRRHSDSVEPEIRGNWTYETGSLWSPDGGVRVARIRRSPRFPCPTRRVPTRDTPTPTCQMCGISTAPRVPFTSTVPYAHSPSSPTPTGDLLPHPSRVIKIVRPTERRRNSAFTKAHSARGHAPP